MLAFEHSQRDQLFQQSYSSVSNVQAPYPGLEMDSFNFSEPMVNFHPLPFSYFENPSFFASAPAQPMKSQTTQPMPSDSVVPMASRLSCDAAPGLASSASSSTVGSPYSGPMHSDSLQNPVEASYDSDMLSQGLGLLPTIVHQDSYAQEFGSTGFDNELPIGHDKVNGNFVDPSLISGPRHFGDGQFSDQAMFANSINSFSSVSPAGSPVPTPNYAAYPQTQFSPHITPENYAHPQFSRRQSIASYHSGSYASPSSEFNEDGERSRCPHSDCGRIFKDLKAHMLTHQAERPEKCPILTCEYNQKGFARKYDKNRHTLTHYKGTMVCGFCPGSGSAAEKSFNRADVFKRHLTTVHGVEQTPPNSRKRSPTSSARKLSSYCQDATGKCSTCSTTFSNAQDFYEHLDDCVLRVVQQEEPSEAINAQHLSSVSSDGGVQETMDRHMIKTEEMPTSFDDDEEDEEDEDEDDDPSFNGRSGKGIKSNKPGSRAVLSGAITKKTKAAQKGFTWSKAGVPLVGKGRKKRKHYPPSWGMSAEKMQMKKRVLCVYDGERRLWKDDMMLHNEFEVRMPLPDGKSYVTDLDVETLNRAEAFHNATEEERGPWLPEEMGQMAPGVDLDQLMS